MPLTRKQCIDWIEALESGEYKQGKGVLHDDETNTYCCLGVLATINNLPTGNLVELDLTIHRSISLSMPKSPFTPVGEFIHMGIPSYPPSSIFQLASLATMNDREYSFEDIAKHLRTQYLPQLKD